MEVRRSGPARGSVKQALTALAFGVASSVVAGVGIVAGLLVGMGIGLPVGIPIGLLVLASIPTGFVFLSRHLIRVPRKPGLTLLWLLVALLAALLHQLVTGRLTAASGSPHTSPVVVVMASVFAAAAVSVVVEREGA